MIYIIVICNGLESPIDLTCDRKRGCLLPVPSDAQIPQIRNVPHALYSFNVS